MEFELAQAAATGDRVAQERIIRAHYDGIHRLARHLSGDHTEAQDLAQQTFVKACGSIGRFDGRSSLRAWLAGILVHEYSHWRRARRFFAQIGERLSPDPTDGLIERELLLRAIRHLPRKQSDAFLLVEVHGFTMAEAAAVLQVPEGTVKSRLSDARSRLRRYLGEAAQPETSAKQVTNES